MVSSPFQCLTLSLLVLPPLLLTTYFLAAFPHPPESLAVHASLASLPKTCPSWDIYPDDFYTGGAYVSFPYGRVRYWLLGPEKGKKIVLIHGLSIPAIIWKDVAPELASRGFRVLLYDLYGRGYSDAPQTTYETPLYVTQLALLMQHIKWDQAHIVGVSMGGGIATAFAAQFPHLVSNKVALIACAGLIETSDLPRTSKFMSSPLVQTLTSSLPFRKYLQHLANSTKASSPINPIQEIVRIQSAHLPGYNSAVASSLRDGPIRGLASAFSSPSLSSKKFLLIHGTADNTVYYKYASRIQSLLPSGPSQSHLITVDGGGHDLTISHPHLVSNALVEFFDSGKV